MNMKKAPNTNKLKYVGAALLEGESVTLIQAARLVLEIKEALGDEICTITRCREVVSLGLNAIKNKHQTVSFGTAAVECLRSKSHRRPRTLTDIRSIIHKLKKSNPELEHTSLRNLSVEECQNILMNTFTTSRQRHKARLILSGIFSFSVKRGWCDENPILRVDTPFLQEQEIPALTLKEITQLLKAAMEEFDGSCAAGAALMIFAGIRPQEVERLVSALAEIKRRYRTDGTGLLSQEYIDPVVATSPQEAFYAPKKSLPLRETVGMVCSEFVMCYPPGIPILAPGERITKEILNYIEYAKAKGCSMTGPEDPDILHLNVLA